MLDKTNESTALERVTGITELVEQIVLFMPINTVFVVQAVSKRFQEVITNSSTVQKRLFLLATKPTKGWIVSNCGVPAPPGVGMPLVLPRIIEEVNAPVPDYKIYSGFVQKAKLNLELFTDIPPPHNSGGSLKPHIRAFHGEKIWFRHSIVPVKRHASYMDMFLTQPPTKFLSLEMSRSPGLSHPDVRGQKIHIYRRDGIRYKHVLEDMGNAMYEEGCRTPALLLHDTMFVSAAEEQRITRDMMKDLTPTWDDDFWHSRSSGSDDDEEDEEADDDDY